MYFKDIYETRKLDEAQAEMNHAIATDPGRHDEPPKTSFDPFAICRKCRIPNINFNGHDVTITCSVMGMYARKTQIEYCADNKRVTKHMEKYYEC